MTETTQNPDSAVKRGVDWVAKHWPRVRLGHEGFMLDKIMRQQQFVEQDAKNVMTGKHDDTTGLPDKGDPMGVKIGDEIHNHNYPAPPPTESPAKKPASTLLKAATIAGLLGGPALGAAAAVGIPWLLGAFDKQPAAEFVDTDTDTQYELRFGEPPAEGGK
jgi:hypothetical protein